VARLIPSFFDDQTPPGERSVFNYLASAPDDWLVIHSLDLAPRNRGIRTEIDFVVVIPDIGILCVEVKSHEAITFDGVRWHPESIKRSPFKQALDGRYCFQRSLAEAVPRLRRVPIGQCCIFPRARFDIAPANISVASTELIDGRAFAAFRDGAALADDLRDRLVRSIEADASLRPLESPITAAEVQHIIDFCTPVQRHRPELRDEIRRREQEAERVLRAQQRPVLKLAALNPRVVVSGGAGTGKTLIAADLAARSADSGNRVALLCFNQLIGDWLERKAHSLTTSPNLVVGRAIKVMATMAQIQIPASPSAEYWNSELPLLIQERFTDPDWAASATFDVIVVDEAQDLLARPGLWDCVAMLADGGVARGRFVLFGDFENQVLAERDVMLSALRHFNEKAKPAHWHLAENCRNYEIVGRMALNLGGIDRSAYDGYLRVGGGHHNYDISFYSSADQQDTLLRRALSEATQNGYRASEVAVLSFCAPERSAADRLRRSGIALRPAWQAGTAPIYTSVSAFKGMESKVVVITDVDVDDSEFHRNLLYTAVTRATEMVRILCSSASTDTLAGWME
jgi:hypothetical protein